ncbi:MAG: EsaB/YukD family protein [Solirubrobacteraceae bacterium]
MAGCFALPPTSTVKNKEAMMAEEHVELTIKSTSGSVKHRFGVEERAKRVLEYAIKHIPLNPNPPRPYVMRLERTGAVLDPNETLARQDVRDGDTVLVQAAEPTDG